MNYKHRITLLILLFCSMIHAKPTNFKNVAVCVKLMNNDEKRSYFSCFNPIKSRHLAAKYTLFKLFIKNKSNATYSLHAKKSGLDLMSPERLARRIETSRSWIPISIATISTLILSSIFYIAYVPAIVISCTLGACATTINPHKTSQKNAQKMLGSLLDSQHETMIESCSTLKKVLAVRTKKNRGKAGILRLENCDTQEVIEIKIQCP